MDIEHNYGYAEYILPCVVNVLSKYKDDIIVEFAISRVTVSMVYYSLT